MVWFPGWTHFGCMAISQWCILSSLGDNCIFIWLPVSPGWIHIVMSITILIAWCSISYHLFLCLFFLCGSILITSQHCRGLGLLFIIYIPYTGVFLVVYSVVCATVLQWIFNMVDNGSLPSRRQWQIIAVSCLETHGRQGFRTRWSCNWMITQSLRLWY